MNYKRNIKLLAWFNFCTDFVFFAPVAMIYFARVTGSFALGMSVFSVAYVSAAVFEVPTGILSDLVGRKMTILLGALCSVLCVVLYALGGSFWTLAIGAVIQGMSRAFYSGNNDALLHDTLVQFGAEKEYHAYLGKTTSMFQVALAIATVTGGFMASKSFPLVMWASVIPQLVGLAIATQILEPPMAHSNKKESTNIFSHMAESIRQFKLNKKLRLLTFASIIRFGVGESSFFLRSVFVNSLWPLWAVGISYMLSNIGAAASFFFSGKIIDRFKPYAILKFEVLFNRVVSFIALLFPSVVSPALMSTTSLTYGVSSVNENALLQKEFTQKQRATMSSLNSLVGNIGFGIISIVLGMLADRFGVRIALLAAQVLLLLPMFFYRKVFAAVKSTP